MASEPSIVRNGNQAPETDPFLTLHATPLIEGPEFLRNLWIAKPHAQFIRNPREYLSNVIRLAIGMASAIHTDGIDWERARPFVVNFCRHHLRSLESGPSWSKDSQDLRLKHVRHLVQHWQDVSRNINIPELNPHIHEMLCRGFKRLCLVGLHAELAVRFAEDASRMNGSIPRRKQTIVPLVESYRPIIQVAERAGLGDTVELITRKLFRSRGKARSRALAAVRVARFMERMEREIDGSPVTTVESPDD